MMKTKIIFCCILSLMGLTAFGQTGQQVTLKTKTGNIEGTLLVPKINKPVPVVLLIAGSGPVDRDGNAGELRMNNLKLIADSLYAHGIATLRYDKRGVGQSREAAKAELDLRFDDFIQDAIGWVNFLSKDKRFSSIVIAGHSQGSLVGMVAAQQKAVAKFVSLEGAGEPILVVLKKQLEQQPTAWLMSAPIIDSLMHGKTVDSVPKILYGLFRPSIQPFWISWNYYNPQTEIKKLDKPVLIVQGTTDIQVAVTDAENLSKADPKAKLEIIKGMNHILKDAPMDRTKNIQTYSQPDLPLNMQFVKVLVNFIKAPEK
jgi:hypothetical protein